MAKSNLTVRVTALALLISSYYRQKTFTLWYETLLAGIKNIY